MPEYAGLFRKMPLNASGMDFTHKCRHFPNPEVKSSKQKQIPKRLTIVNINCRSVVDKDTELKYFTDQTKPDIIVGTESWLNDNHYNNEIFDTEQYSIFRKDRKEKRGGGVFLAIRHSLNPTCQPELDSSAEIIWAKVDIPGLKNVYICSSDFFHLFGNSTHTGSIGKNSVVFPPIGKK